MTVLPGVPLVQWRHVRIDGVATEHRRAVTPSGLGAEVFHYSIPAFDQIGDGVVEASSSIGSQKLLLEGGELLVSKLNPRKSRVLQAETHGLPTVASTEFVALRLGPEILGSFARYLLLAETTRQALDSQVQSVTRSQQRASPAAISKLWTYLPPLEEQRRIADHLDAETVRIDALIVKRQRQIDLLAERSSRLVNSALDGHWIRRIDGVPVGIEGWRSVRLGSLAQVQSGLTLDGGRPNDGLSRSYPYLRVANVHDGAVDLGDVKEVTVPTALAARCMLRDGDVLMTEGGDPDKLGRGSVWWAELDPCLHQNHVFAVRTDRLMLRPEFLALVTSTQYARAYFEMTASKTTGIASTSSSKIASFRVPLPTVAEQVHLVTEITGRLDQTARVRDVLVRQIGLLRERRQAMITAAVTRQLVVP